MRRKRQNYDYHKEMAEEAVKKDPSLRLAKGWYICPRWGRQEHWWTVRKDGTINDPTKDQFPSKGTGEYEEFNGYYLCEQCGKQISEGECISAGRFVVCSENCYRRLVGVW